MKCNVSNAWRRVPTLYANVNNTWRNVFQAYSLGSDNVWRPIFHYWYQVGDWSGCSVTDCGQSGIQTRVVQCYRSNYRASNTGNLDDQTYVAVDDSYCAKYGLTKPTTQQGCSTAPCPTWHVNQNLADFNPIYTNVIDIVCCY